MQGSGSYKFTLWQLAFVKVMQYHVYKYSSSMKTKYPENQYSIISIFYIKHIPFLCECSIRIITMNLLLDCLDLLPYPLCVKAVITYYSGDRKPEFIEQDSWQHKSSKYQHAV